MVATITPDECESIRKRMSIISEGYMLQGIDLLRRVRSLTDSKKILLLLDKTPHFDYRYWEFPSGKRKFVNEIKENSFECAIREVKEETGIDVRNYTKVIDIPISSTVITHDGKIYTMSYLIMKCDDEVQPYITDTEEILDCKWISDDEMKPSSKCMAPYTIAKKLLK